MNQVLKNKIKILEKEQENVEELDISEMEKIVDNDSIKNTLEEIKDSMNIKDKTINELSIMKLTRNNILREVVRFYLECQDIIIKDSFDEENEILKSNIMDQYFKDMSKYNNWGYKTK